MSAGFRDARDDQNRPMYDVLYGVDKDSASIQTFRENIFRDLPETERARRAPQRTVVGLEPSEILAAAGVANVDVVIGGPNCQAVSSAGLRNAADERNDMFGHFLRLVGALQPNWFVMENVPGLTHAPGLPILADVFERLATLHGYEVAGDVLLAADYGVSQYRYRLVVVGTRSGAHLRLPEPTHFKDKEPRHRTVGDVLSREPSDPITPLGEDDLNRARIHHVPMGGDWRDIPTRLLPPRSFSVRTSDQKGAYGRLEWDRPAFTITGLASNVTAGPFTHPVRDRAITPAEAAALQGFPADYTFKGKPAAQYQQIGNAVPPPLARAIAEIIPSLERGEEVGKPARLTREVVNDALKSGKSLPVMTPRIDVRPSPRRPAKQLSRPSIVPAEPASSNRLEVEAKLPAYMWTAKRARAILGNQQGRELAAIAAELKVSESSVGRWIADYETAGAEGWRAYHTATAAIAGGDAELTRRLDGAIRAVRRASLESESGRPSMTPRLAELIERFGDWSVNDIRAELIQHGVHVGVMYVGDLLAIAEVVLPAAARAHTATPA